MTAEEILNKNGFDLDKFAFDNEYSAKNLLKSMEQYRNEGLEGMYEREFVEWIGEVDVKYHSARFNVWILHDDFKNRMTTDELYLYWQKEVKK
jgi:hypothetical protein